MAWPRLRTSRPGRGRQVPSPEVPHPVAYARVLRYCFVALSAAVPASRPDAAAGPGTCSRRLPRRPRRHPGATTPARRRAARPAGDHLRPDRPAAGQAAAGQFAAGASTRSCPCFEKQGGYVGHRAADLPLLHPAEAARACRRTDKWVPYDDDDREDHRRTTSSGCGTPTSSTTCSIDVQRLHVPQRRRSARSSSTTWRSGSASRSSTTSARRRSRSSKIDEKLKRSQRPDPPRLVHRSRPGPARSRASSATCCAEKGFQFAEVTPRDQGDPGRPEAGAPHLPHGRRAEGQDPQDRLRRQQGDQRRHAQAADEGEQGAGPFRLHPFPTGSSA